MGYSFNMTYGCKDDKGRQRCHRKAAIGHPFAWDTSGRRELNELLFSNSSLKKVEGAERGLSYGGCLSENHSGLVTIRERSKAQEQRISLSFRLDTNKERARWPLSPPLLGR